MQKLIVNYAKKNKKKEHSEIIGLINTIPNTTRDHLLIKYIAQCKLAHALCFFQWRYFKLKVDSPESAAENKKIFKQRINAMIRHCEWSVSLRKTIHDQSKKNHKERERVRIMATAVKKKLSSMNTVEELSMVKQKKDSSLFSNIP